MYNEFVAYVECFSSHSLFQHDFVFMDFTIGGEPSGRLLIEVSGLTFFLNCPREIFSYLTCAS